MASEQIVIATVGNFEQEVLKSEEPVLVDFWAPWCGPCRTISPVLDELADEYKGKIKVAKINVDEEGDLAAKFRVMSIPTLMLFKNGQIAEKITGARPKEELSKLITNNI